MALTHSIWKSESLQREFSDLLSIYEDAESWLFEDDNPVGKTKVDFNEDKTSQCTPAETAFQLLSSLDDIKEEPIQDWLEEKMVIPIFEDIPCSEIRQDLNVESLKIFNDLDKESETEKLLKELESAATFDYHLTLTPPTSPIHYNELTQSCQSNNNNGSISEPFLITSMVHMSPQYIDQNNTSPSSVISIENPNKATFDAVEIVSFSVDDELAAVDELVRSQAERLVLPHLSNEIYVEESDSAHSVPPSPSSSTPFSPSSSTPLSPSSSISLADLTDDPDWNPESYIPVVKNTISRKRSRKPYSRQGQEEKKIRKKEQNKNAAIRYRQKKKAEIEEIFEEEKELQDRNCELKEKITDIQREIKCLKGLMKDLLKAKGLLK